MQVQYLPIYSFLFILKVLLYTHSHSVTRVYLSIFVFHIQSWTFIMLNSSHSLCCKKTKLWLRCLPTPTDLLFPSCPSLRGVGQLTSLYCAFENAASKRQRVCVCVRKLIKELSDTISCSLIFFGVMDGPLQHFSIKEMLLAAIKNT